MCASSMVCAGGVCQLCAAARSRRLLIKQAVLPPNPDHTTRARCCRLVLGAYLANFSGFFFALFFFSRPLLLDTPKADKAMRLGVLESRESIPAAVLVEWLPGARLGGSEVGQEPGRRSAALLIEGRA